MKLGFGFSYSGNLTSLENRIRISRGNAFQIFSRGLRGVDSNGKPRAIKQLNNNKVAKFLSFINSSNISYGVLHAPYSYNLAQEKLIDKNKEEIQQFELIAEDLYLARKLNMAFYVLQPGYLKGLSAEVAIQNFNFNLEKALKLTDFKGRILIRNTVGAGTEWGSDLKELSIFKSLGVDVGYAIDFSRLYGYGYDLLNKKGFENALNLITENIGWHNIEVLYFNDYDRFCGERKNQYANIGEGLLGLNIYEDLVKLPEVHSKVSIIEFTKKQEQNKYDEVVNFFNKASRNL